MHRRFRLGTRFTLLLLLLLLIGITVSWAALSRALLRRAEAEVISKGQTLIDLMSAVRSYTSLNVAPRLESVIDVEEVFVREVVPAYSARQVFQYLRTRADYARYTYKEATTTPRNQRNLADAFEAELLERFRSTPDLEEISGFRTVAGESLFYSARPLRITQPYCLRCHTTAAEAPVELVETYGAAGGFGWELGEVVAAQIITVPAEEVLSSARLSLVIVMAIFVVVSAALVFAINLQLRRWVIQPVERISTLAQRVGLGELAQEEAGSVADLAERPDELGHLAQVFQEMADEVYAREQRLREQVQDLAIQIDQARRFRQVAEIIDSDYFQELQKKARELRDRMREQSPSDVELGRELSNQDEGEGGGGLG